MRTGNLRWRLRRSLLFPLLGRLPPWAAYPVAAPLGAMTEDSRRTVQDAVEGLSRVYPGWPGERRRAVAEAQRAMLAREMLDVFFLPRLHAGNMDGFIRLEGVGRLERAREGGRPVILYSGHFGRLIMPAMALGAAGVRSSCLTADIGALPEGQRRFQQLKIDRMQRLMGGDMISKADPYRRLYRALEGGAVLIVIVDAPPGPEDRRAWAPFLGGRLLVSPGALRLARRTGAALVPYFAVEDDGRLVGRIEPEVEIEGLDDEAALGRIFAPLARMVDRHPEQWWLWEAVPALWRPDADPRAGG